MTDLIESVAARLRNAYDGGPVGPLRDAMSPTDSELAYAVQAANTRYWANSGRTVVGHKVGLTATAVQKQLGVDQPDFGVLFADMQIQDEGILDLSKCIAPRAEAEVALVLERDLNDPAATAESVFAAVAYAVAAIEIVDSRIADWKITFADTVADNGSSAYFVLGKDRKKLRDLDLFTCGMALTIDSDIVSLGAGAACLGHPLNAAAWLARTLAASGEGLKAGDIMLTGALGPMVGLKAGNSVRAQIGGLGQCGFTVA
ncbi:MAG: fumarylacetoacetate hydrolase family protein [Pseudomonadota bacterium]|nr:fumarylacetoacetate hydrolase family protein [Pseudomonadota bacterium]